MADFKIKKGYDVPILGEPQPVLDRAAQPAFVGVCPVEFSGVKPKLCVQVNDLVKVGSPLFFDKKRRDLVFLAPASGKIAAINYGPRRVIEEIIIATDKEYQYESFQTYDLKGITGFDRQGLIGHLMKGGVWPYIRQRPFNKIADPEAEPKAVFVNCMDTAPLANDPNFSLTGMGDVFEAGVAALSVLCERVHVCTRGKGANPQFQAPKNVAHHRFSGKHPAGLTGTHISRIDPLNKGESVWYINARDVVMIGTFLLKGLYPIERIVAIAGPAVARPRYLRSQLGVKIKDLVDGEIHSPEPRYISGNILTGIRKSTDNFLGFYDDLISVLTEGRKQEFLGWMQPGLSKPSFTRVYLSGFLGSKKYKMDTNLNGGHRAIIQSGTYDRVVALDVFPEFLLKATIAQDIDEMEKLGILECDPEDFALCTYLCPSKTEVSQIISEGLELMEKEG